MRVFGSQTHNLLVDQLVEHKALVLGGFKFARVEVVALLLTRLHARLLKTGTEVLDADFVVVPKERHRPP
ncbi:hypothetical protein D3C71_2166330 [compost metagenome]